MPIPNARAIPRLTSSTRACMTTSSKWTTPKVLEFRPSAGHEAIGVQPLERDKLILQNEMRMRRMKARRSKVEASLDKVDNDFAEVARKNPRMSFRDIVRVVSTERRRATATAISQERSKDDDDEVIFEEVVEVPSGPQRLAFKFNKNQSETLIHHSDPSNPQQSSTMIPGAEGLHEKNYENKFSNYKVPRHLDGAKGRFQKRNERSWIANRPDACNLIRLAETGQSRFSVTTAAESFHPVGIELSLGIRGTRISGISLQRGGIKKSFHTCIIQAAIPQGKMFEAIKQHRINRAAEAERERQEELARLKAQQNQQQSSQPSVSATPSPSSPIPPPSAPFSPDDIVEPAPYAGGSSNTQGYYATRPSNQPQVNSTYGQPKLAQNEDMYDSLMFESVQREADDIRLQKASVKRSPRITQIRGGQQQIQQLNVQSPYKTFQVASMNNLEHAQKSMEKLQTFRGLRGLKGRDLEPQQQRQQQQQQGGMMGSSVQFSGASMAGMTPAERDAAMVARKDMQAARQSGIASPRGRGGRPGSMRGGGMRGGFRGASMRTGGFGRGGGTGMVALRDRMGRQYQDRTRSEAKEDDYRMRMMAKRSRKPKLGDSGYGVPMSKEEEAKIDEDKPDAMPSDFEVLTLNRENMVENIPPLVWTESGRYKLVEREYGIIDSEKMKLWGPSAWSEFDERQKKVASEVLVGQESPAMNSLIAGLNDKSNLMYQNVDAKKVIGVAERLVQKNSAYYLPDETQAMGMIKDRLQKMQIKSGK